MLRRCRVCGCSDEQPCAGGCTWVSEDLCSACATPEAMNFWEQLAVFEAQYSPDTPVVIWGPMGQREERPLIVARCFVTEAYDAFDALNCGLDLVNEEGGDVV